MHTLFALIALLLSSLQPAWTSSTDPKLAPPELAREFRALWVASVANIDWPSQRGVPAKQLRDEMNRIILAAKTANLNAIVLQVRPACDALYESKIEPWSEFLTGLSGRAPDGNMDPLREWIDAAHAQGLELHAWINPFRARHFESKQPDAPSHITKTHPEWVRSYDQYLWLDPGEEGARAHSLAVALDIVGRYDLDGLHYDDYFYPYPKGKDVFPDDAPFQRYAAGGGRLARDDWRRANIDAFVKNLYEQVKKTKPQVKVGVSPFGIWRPGSPPPVQGFDQYASLYADARRWLREGWLDYSSPQLYWPRESKGQPFVRLLDWWVDQNDQHRHIWPGLNASRVLAAGALGKDNKPAASWDPAEIIGQVEATRTALAPGSSGNVFFSAVALVDNRRGLADQLHAGPYAAPALIPASPWLRVAPPATPPAIPVLRVTDAKSSQQLILPDEPAARWWGVWGRLANGWRFQLISAATIRERAKASGEPASVSLPAGLTGVAAFWVDSAGFASPTAVLMQDGR